MRAAAYGRFSSDLQKATSITDQIAVARAFAQGKGWVFLEEHVYSDAAVSGSSLDRPGVQALRDAALSDQRPFDVILVDDTSRVSRDIADAVRFMQELTFAGVRVIYIAQNIDSFAKQAETLVAVHGLVDSLYRTELAQKVKRGLAGQVERGFATGSITFGYRTIAVPDPTGRMLNGSPVLLGKRVEVVPDEARVVQRVFELYASGLGTGKIVARLNKEGCRGPRGARWKAGAVKWLLANEKYTGCLILGRTTTGRRPGTRQLVVRPAPRAEWKIHQLEELRIISAELWQRVQSRRASIRALVPPEGKRRLMRGRDAALFSPHLFSGFMRCGVCGGAITVVTGGYGSPRYGCPASWRNGTDVCSNRLTIRAKVADAYLLAGLKNELLAPATVNYVTDVLSAVLNRQIDERPRLMAEARAERDEAKQRLQRLIHALQEGVPASALSGEIAARQADIQRLDGTLAELDEPLQQKLAVMPNWVRQQLEDLVRHLLGAPERTKAEFQQLGLAVTMQPNTGADARPFYRAEVVNAIPALAGVVDMPSNLRSTVDRSLLQRVR
jgi:DNA invertase Pin-like site-specific DNA recombinase